MSRKPKTTLISRWHDPTPASCRVNPLGATTDFTQEDMLDGPSCGDAMRPEGAAAAEATAVGFGAVTRAVFL